MDARFFLDFDDSVYSVGQAAELQAHVSIFHSEDGVLGPRIDMYLSALI